MKICVAVGLWILLALVALGSDRSEVRTARRFIGLLQQRLLLSRQVAMAKFNSGAPVEDLKRERELLEKTLKVAGRGHELAQRVLQSQIDASKTAQRKFIAKWAGHPRFKHAPDLAREIRPKLDKLTKEMLSMMRSVLGTSVPTLRRAARRVRWPKQDVDCFSPHGRSRSGP